MVARPTENRFALFLAAALFYCRAADGKPLRTFPGRRTFYYRAADGKPLRTFPGRRSKTHGTFSRFADLCEARFRLTRFEGGVPLCI
jgi:hypothetical protein